MKNHTLIIISDSHHKLHSGDINHVKHAQIQYVDILDKALVLGSLVYVPIGHDYIKCSIGKICIHAIGHTNLL